MTNALLPEPLSERWARGPEKDGRAKAFKTYHLVNAPDAEHWLRETTRFLAE